MVNTNEMRKYFGISLVARRKMNQTLTTSTLHLLTMFCKLLCNCRLNYPDLHHWSVRSRIFWFDDVTDWLIDGQSAPRRAGQRATRRNAVMWHIWHLTWMSLTVSSDCSGS